MRVRQNVINRVYLKDTVRSKSKDFASNSQNSAGGGIHTDVREITLENGELITSTDYETELYRPVVL